MRTLCWSLVIAGSLAASPAAADAQARRLGRQAPPAEARAGRSQDRQALEARFRERFRMVVRERLNATEDQVNKLLDVEQRLGSRKYDLIRRERDVRLNLRTEMARNADADDAVIAQLVDQSIQLQKQRVELLEAEQRELAGFLSPRQRAMHMGLQEQLRRQMEDARERREGGAPGQRRPRRPGGDDAPLLRPGSLR
jgi:hypothetical protein